MLMRDCAMNYVSNSFIDICILAGILTFSKYMILYLWYSVFDK